MHRGQDEQRSGVAATAESSKQGGAPLPSPNIDPELVPLPFLVFSGGLLRSANEGARTLLGLEDGLLKKRRGSGSGSVKSAGDGGGSGESDEGTVVMLVDASEDAGPSGGRYSYEDLFPPAIDIDNGGPAAGVQSGIGLGLSTIPAAAEEGASAAVRPDGELRRKVTAGPAAGASSAAPSPNSDPYSRSSSGAITGQGATPMPAAPRRPSTSIAINKLDARRHLQSLRACVQSSGELIKCKAAVHTNENSERESWIRSILIVDVSPEASPASSPPSSSLSPLERARQRQQSAGSGPSPDPLLAGSGSPPSRSATVGKAHRQRQASAPPASLSGRGYGSAADSTPYSATSPHHPHPTRPSLPSAIKRHSGDIRKIFANTIERKWNQMSQSQAAAPAAQSHAGPSASTSSTATEDALAGTHPVRPSVSPIPTNSHNDAGRSNSTNSESTASTGSTVPASEASTMATSAGSVGPGSSGTGKTSSRDADEPSVATRGLSSKTSTSGPSGIAATAPTMSISYSEMPSDPSFRGSLHRKRASITSMEPNISPPVSPKGSPHPLPASSAAGAMHFSDHPSSSASLTASRVPGLPTRHSNSDGSSGASSHQTRASRLARTFAAETADFSLAQSALAAHPRTGVIISKQDLSSGFINSRTRELLMGIRSPEHEYSTDPFDDMWYSAAAAKERRPPPEASLFEDDAQSIESATEQPGQSPVWEDDIVFEDGKVRIDLPDRGQNLETSISDILRWSLRRRRIRQHHRVLRDETASNMSTRSGISGSGSGGYGGGGSGGPYGSAFSPSGSVSGLGYSSLPRSSMAMTPEDAAIILQGLKEDDASRPWIAIKPYKVYDPAFSQRIEDPFEALFDQCIRKGVTPPGGDNSITVGIETQVGPAETCGFPESECFTYSSETVDGAPGSGLVQIRVRRRVVQARAAPLKDVNGDHIGGVVWLRDITGESGDPKSSAHLSVPQEVGTGPSGEGNALASDSVAAAIPGYQGPSGLDASTFWQQIINSMPQMVWVTKPDGSHIYFNNKWYSYTGLQPEQSLGVNWQNPFHPDDMPGTRRAWSRSLATGEPYSVEYRCRRHDGVWRWQLGRAQAMFDANGTIIAWFGTLTDIEEGMQLRTQLAETTRNLRRVIDLANVTLLCVDRDLKLLFMDGGRQMLSVVAGPDEKSLIGAELSSILPDPAFTKKAQQVLDGLESARVEFEIRPDNWIGCHLTPLREKAGEPPHGVVVVCTEITDLKEAEKALRKSSEEQARLLASETAAKEASRLKSEFTANLSHEIRTPITGMIGMSELLLEEEMSAGQHDSVRKILRSGEILLKMVGDVLDIGKVEAGKLELDIQPFALQDLVTDATTMFRTAATKKGLRFNEETSNLYRGEVLGDLPRMRQVLLNFLANSVKFTKQGFITLKVRQDQETESDIIVRFVVEDSGIGIAKNVVPILFQAFQQADSTTSREHGGTGLGLAISKRLVELMDGTVKLESDLGKGTKITVLVPFQKSTNPPTRRPSTRSRNSGSSGASSATAGRKSLEAGDRTSSASPSDSVMASTPERSTSSSAGSQQKISPPRAYTNQGAADRAHAGTQSQARVQFAPSSPPPADRSSLTARSASSAANTAESAGKARDDLDRSSIWILLAEDNALNSEIFTRGITRMGFNVRAVVNGEEAVRAMHEREWDLVLLDGQMPVMDGYEAARRIRLDPDPKISQVTVIALTASAISGDREKCLAAGMTDYLAKPVRLKVLEETLVSHLKRSQAAKEQQADKGDRPAAGMAPQNIPPPIQSKSSFDARSFP